MREQQFSGEDGELFLNFLQRIFRWLPGEQPTAEELAYDDFLMQAVLQRAAQIDQSQGAGIFGCVDG